MMRQFLSEHKRLIFSIVTLIALTLTLLETNRFLQEFKQEENDKMQILALAYQKMLEADAQDIDLLNLSLNILEKNHTIPIIIIDKDSTVFFQRNLSKKDSLHIMDKIHEYASYNTPITLDLEDGNYQYLYYGNSSLLNKLTYYPLVLVGIFLLFAAIVYLYYRTGKVSDENRLWSGLAKETAHQIGTPLSSLMGWVEILKVQNNPDIPVDEIEKDVQRLNIISQRFSKIGSTPALEKVNLTEITRRTLNYMRDRTSKLVNIQLNAPENIEAKLNPQLYSWVIENLIKNAIDAMDGKGKITIQIAENNKQVLVDITDSGKGIPASKHKKIFNPGYTTKKRGWGLGLSLAKRIIEQYHKGKIFVLKSKPGEGTTFRIVLNK